MGEGQTKLMRNQEMLEPRSLNLYFIIKFSHHDLCSLAYVISAQLNWREVRCLPVVVFCFQLLPPL